MLALLILACAPSTVSLDTACDSAAVEVQPWADPPTWFVCDSNGAAVDLPEEVVRVDDVQVGETEADLVSVEDWSLSATRLIVGCEAGNIGIAIWGR